MIARVLVGMDFSECAYAALHYAGLVARHLSAELHIVNVLPTRDGRSSDPGNARFPLSEQEIRENLGQGVAADRRIELKTAGGYSGKIEIENDQVTGNSLKESSGIHVIQARREHSSPAGGILSYADEAGCDLIVMGTHGRTGIDRFILGSVAEEVVRKSTRPCLTLKPTTHKRSSFPPARILIPIDFTPISAPSIHFAASLAKIFGSTLDLFHIVEEVRVPEFYGLSPLPIAVPDIFARCKVALRDLLFETGHKEIPYELHVTAGKPSDKILDFITRQGSDLVVMGAHSEMDLPRLFLGSVSERIMRLGKCPIITMRAPSTARAYS